MIERRTNGQSECERGGEGAESWRMEGENMGKGSRGRGNDRTEDGYEEKDYSCEVKDDEAS